MYESICISDYLTDEIIEKIIKDLEESNDRKIKDFEFVCDEIELDISWKRKKRK